MALSDLLSGRSVDDMLESLPRLWELSFRARDDIKVCTNCTIRFEFVTIRTIANMQQIGDNMQITVALLQDNGEC